MEEKLDELKLDIGKEIEVMELSETERKWRWERASVGYDEVRAGKK